MYIFLFEAVKIHLCKAQRFRCACFRYKLSHSSAPVNYYDILSSCAVPGNEFSTFQPPTTPRQVNRDPPTNSRPRDGARGPFRRQCREERDCKCSALARDIRCLKQGVLMNVISTAKSPINLESVTHEYCRRISQIRVNLEEWAGVGGAVRVIQAEQIRPKVGREGKLCIKLIRPIASVTALQQRARA